MLKTPRETWPISGVKTAFWESQSSGINAFRLRLCEATPQLVQSKKKIWVSQTCAQSDAGPGERCEISVRDKTQNWKFYNNWRVKEGAALLAELKKKVCPEFLSFALAPPQLIWLNGGGEKKKPSAAFFFCFFFGTKHTGGRLSSMPECLITWPEFLVFPPSYFPLAPL